MTNLYYQSSMFPHADKKHIVTTYDDHVLSSQEFNMGNISPCNQEGDYHSVLHCYNMSKCELNTIILITVDTDVVAISVSCFNEMDLDELWIKFDNGGNLR